MHNLLFSSQFYNIFLPCCFNLTFFLQFLYFIIDKFGFFLLQIAQLFCKVLNFYIFMIIFLYKCIFSLILQLFGKILTFLSFFLQLCSRKISTVFLLIANILCKFLTFLIIWWLFLNKLTFFCFSVTFFQFLFSFDFLNLRIYSY